MTYRCLLRNQPFLGSALLACLACNSPHGPSDTSPTGPVAHDADEAWPEEPANVPILRVDDIANACATAGACSPEVMELDVATRAELTDMCISEVIFSAERAIPLTGFRQANERAEFWVRCVLDNASQCDVVNACRTDRAPSIICEEDGCRSRVKHAISCNGNVATLTSGEGTWTRDCTRAFAVCDPDSETGCTDRHFSTCPEDHSRADRCDGNVRLGCDGKDQVSYRDCARLGGTCGTEADGSEGCVYPAADVTCPKSAVCDGTTLTVCVDTRTVSVESALCTAE